MRDREGQAGGRERERREMKEKMGVLLIKLDPKKSKQTTILLESPVHTPNVPKAQGSQTLPPLPTQDEKVTNP